MFRIPGNHTILEYRWPWQLRGCKCASTVRPHLPWWGRPLNWFARLIGVKLITAKPMNYSNFRAAIVDCADCAERRPKIFIEP